MARCVILMRHAHAQWPQFAGRDFDRPLTPRGESDAARAGAAIAAAGLRPDFVLASPAARTMHTARIVAAALDLPADVIAGVDSLYNADPATLEIELRQAAANHATVLLVAHNPGISELARKLSDGAVVPPFEPANWCQLDLPA